MAAVEPEVIAIFVDDEDLGRQAARQRPFPLGHDGNRGSAQLPIMTKWKWVLVQPRLPAKVFVINENGDYFWLDRGHSRAILHFALFRAGLTGSGAARTIGTSASHFRSLCCICYSMHQPFIFAAHGEKATR